MLAAALRGDDAPWPSDWSASELLVRVGDRIAYHGIAGLITGRAPDLGDWPAALLSRVREQALALAMWEFRHKAVLGELLAAFAEEKVDAAAAQGDGAGL